MTRRTGDIALIIVASLATLLLGIVTYAGSHGPVRQPVLIEPCAAVIVRGEEQSCR